MKRIALILTVLATCAAAPTPDALTGIRERATIGPLTVRPLAIVEDSRCPSDGLCIWAGRVVVRVAVEGPGVARTIMLAGDKPFPIAGGTLALTRVEPARPRGKPIAPSAYRFGFRFKDGL